MRTRAPSAEEASNAVAMCEDVYSNYMDARRRMNELRLARGFYPNIALVSERAAKGSGSGKG